MTGSGESAYRSVCRAGAGALALPPCGGGPAFIQAHSPPLPPADARPARRSNSVGIARAAPGDANSRTTTMAATAATHTTSAAALSPRANLINRGGESMALDANPAEE